KGTLIYHDVFRKNNADVDYPVPWADDISHSFLGTISTMNDILKDLEFTKLKTTDQTYQAVQFLTGIFEKIEIYFLCLYLII
ncbi:MAG: hypothetical protein ACTSSP_06560, partial [Candidatus Asgardarchaeia archaeon]